MHVPQRSVHSYPLIGIIRDWAALGSVQCKIGKKHGGDAKITVNTRSGEISAFYHVNPIGWL